MKQPGECSWLSHAKQEHYSRVSNSASKGQFVSLPPLNCTVSLTEYQLSPCCSLFSWKEVVFNSNICVADHEHRGTQSLPENAGFCPILLPCWVSAIPFELIPLCKEQTPTPPPPCPLHALNLNMTAFMISLSAMYRQLSPTIVESSSVQNEIYRWHYPL